MYSANSVILIVEDDPNDQIFIRRAIKESGITDGIATVSDGEEAVAYLTGVYPHDDRVTHPLPRLIITDLKMPRMGGIELLKWINAREEFRFIPVVALTSSSNETDVANAFLHGAKGYMIKPVQFGELEKMVRTIADYWQFSRVPGFNLAGREDF